LNLEKIGILFLSSILALSVALGLSNIEYDMDRMYIVYTSLLF